MSEIAAPVFTNDVAAQIDMERAARLVGYANARRYRARARSLFRDVPLKGVSVLDVGCGTGAWAIWAALQGARKAVGVEPEAAGSTTGTLNLFRRNIRLLGLEDRLDAYGCTLQDFPVKTRFDIIVLYAVINHLDEEAVATLDRDPAMERRYVKVVGSLRDKTTTGGTVIVFDGARSNFWDQLGLRCPFDWTRTIEWHKHQNPSVWIRVFEKAAFRASACRGAPIYPLGTVTTHSWAQYLTRSQFVITFKAI